MISKFRKAISILLSAFFLAFSFNTPSFANQINDDSPPLIIKQISQSEGNTYRKVLRLEGSKTFFDLVMDDEGNFFIKTETQLANENESPTNDLNSLTVSSSSDLDVQSYRNQEFDILPEAQLQARSLTPTYTELVNLASSNSVVVQSNVGHSSDSSDNGNPLAPQAVGTSQVPYSGSRVLGGTTNPAQADPYRRSVNCIWLFVEPRTTPFVLLQ